MKYYYTSTIFSDTDWIFTCMQDFRHWTMKTRLLCWKGLRLKLCSSVPLRFSIRNFQLDIQTYWRKEFERVVCVLVNGKNSLFLQVKIAVFHCGGSDLTSAMRCAYCARRGEWVWKGRCWRWDLWRRDSKIYIVRTKRQKYSLHCTVVKGQRMETLGSFAHFKHGENIAFSCRDYSIQKEIKLFKSSCRKIKYNTIIHCYQNMIKVIIPTFRYGFIRFQTLF